ncbi:MAG: TatD family hydrolase [Desulfurococcaceae archaeon]
MFVDAHLHCAEINDIDKYVNSSNWKIACVSDDIESSHRVLEISRIHSEKIIPCVGVHPWVIHEHNLKIVRSALDRALLEHQIICLGEVGLDKRFKPDTYPIQLEFFTLFLNYAKEYDLSMNLHAAGAWREVFERVYQYDIQKAYFHWYTGPLDLLSQIESIGYYVGINPSWIIQDKHRVVIEKTNIGSIITESDAPYRYKGLELKPDLIKNTIEYLSRIKELNIEVVKKVVLSNFNKLFSK